MLRLIRDNVGIIPIADPEKIGSIIVPDMAKERTDQGIIKYVGPDCKFAEIGMYVTFSGYSGTALKVEDGTGHVDERLIIIPERFITAQFADFPSTDIHGLYFRDREGQYWTATYEQAMELIGQAFREADWRMYDPRTNRGINVKSRRPSAEEYESK